MLPSIKLEEKRWTGFVIILAIVLTTLPYFIGLTAAGSEWEFSGFLFGVTDGNSYLAKMLRGYAGEWLFRTPYTSGEQDGMLAFLPYLLLGKLTSPPAQHLQLVILYHLFRILGLIFMIGITESFLERFLRKKVIQRWALMMIILGGGLGWIPVLIGRLDWLEWIPLSFYSPETFGFLAGYGIPHLTFSRGLLFLGVLKIMDGRGARSGAAAGIFWLVMALFQPLNLAVAWLVTGGYGVSLLLLDWLPAWKPFETDRFSTRKQLLSIFWALGITLPVMIYYGWMSQTGTFSSWQAQSKVLSPGLVEYLLAYGLILPFAAAFVVGKKTRKFSRREWMLIIWMIMLPLLINMPINSQRRLAEGSWAALVTLGALALDSPDGPLRRTWRWVWLLAFPAAVILLAGGAASALNPARPIYVPENEVEAYLYLKDHSSKTDVVLSSFKTGNALPAWAPVFVVLGHPAETLDYQETSKRVQDFYQGGLDHGEMARMLEAFSVDYVFWGPSERELAEGFVIEHPCLKKTYGDRYQIFRVNCESSDHDHGVMR